MVGLVVVRNFWFRTARSGNWCLDKKLIPDVGLSLAELCICGRRDLRRAASGSPRELISYVLVKGR